MRRPADLSALLAACVALIVWAVNPAVAATCTADDIPAAVDATGAQLRTYTMQSQPVLQPKLKALAAKNGWADEGYEEPAFLHLKDAKLDEFDKTANELLARIDQLGEVVPGAPVDCARLEGIKAAGVELLAVMKAKTAHVTAKIDAELGAAQPAPKSVAAEAVTPPVQPGPTAAPAPVPPPPSVPAKTAALDKSSEAPPPVRKPAAEGWQTKTSPSASPPAVAQAPAVAAGPIPGPIPPPSSGPIVGSGTGPGQPPRSNETAVAVLPPTTDQLPGGGARPSEGLRAPRSDVRGDDEYTIEEIRDASRGFFGDVSSGLASVIEHAFRRSGRPTGYILGNEGGGAFIGGLRYGSGTLYMRRGGTEQVYWHGPSLGFDFGASGTRTIFLVYKAREPLDLYRTFTGIDGSAFAVGGVGITLLSGGNMVLAPIRSGLGLRLGASIGYIRFTPTRTWNPL